MLTAFAGATLLTTDAWIIVNTAAAGAQLRVRLSSPGFPGRSASAMLTGQEQ
ncbi:MAG: hypothetical protein M3Y49_13055 [Actinomycetota bacterium]|nr:hypothetical protein [Actinomycetota bacterium]